MVVQPTEHARGPWDPRALHGGAPAALIAAAFERVEPGAELRIARLGFEFLRPIPFAPLRLSTRIVRPGRRVQELAGELASTRPRARSSSSAARARCACSRSAPTVAAAAPVRPADGAGHAGGRALPPPEDGTPVRFALERAPSEASFAASAMEMRWLDDPRALGPGARVDAPAPPAPARRAADAARAAGRDRRLRQRRQRRAAVRALPVHQRRPHDPPAAPPARRVDRPRRAHAAARAAAPASPRACCTTSTDRSAAHFRRSSSSRAERPENSCVCKQRCYCRGNLSQSRQTPPATQESRCQHQIAPPPRRRCRRALGRSTRSTRASSSRSNTWASQPSRASSTTSRARSRSTPDGLNAYGTVDVASVDTREPQRDAHLRSATSSTSRTTRRSRSNRRPCVRSTTTSSRSRATSRSTASPAR